MVPDVAIHGRLQTNADQGFFFRNKPKARADLDLSEPTTFADSRGTGCPSGRCHLRENSKAIIVLMEADDTSNPGVLTPGTRHRR